MAEEATAAVARAGVAMVVAAKGVAAMAEAMEVGARGAVG